MRRGGGELLPFLEVLERTTLRKAFSEYLERESNGTPGKSYPFTCELYHQLELVQVPPVGCSADLNKDRNAEYQEYSS